MAERLRFYERQTIKSKDNELREARNDMELMKSSINEVFIMLIETQEEAEKIKKRSQFDITKITQMTKQALIEKNKLKKTYET